MLFTFSVVIDHAKNPSASTGNFECVYRQPTTPLQITKYTAQTLQIYGTALQLDKRLFVKDKVTAVHMTNEPYLNMYNESKSKYNFVNVIKESDNNALLIPNHDKKRGALPSHTETKAKLDYNNYSDLNTGMELCAYIAPTKLNTLAKSDNGNNMDVNQDKMMHPHITDTPNVISKSSNDSQLNGNKDNYTYKRDIQFNFMTELEDLFWTWVNECNDYSTIKKLCMTHTEQNAITKLDSEHLDMNHFKNICPYTKQVTNVRTPDKYMELNPNREIHSKSNSLAVLHDDDYLDLNSDKEITLYVTHSKSYTKTESHNDDHLNLNNDKEVSAGTIHHTEPITIADLENYKHFYLPEKEYNNLDPIRQPNNDKYLKFNSDKDTCVYKTHIEPNAIVEQDNNVYLDLGTDNKRSTYLTFTKSTTVAKKYKNDHLDLNPGNNEKTGAYVAHIQPNAISKLDK